MSEEWELSSGERLLVAAAGLDWARALIRRSREHLQLAENTRAQPIAAELGLMHERLSGLERLLGIIRMEEKEP